jgi:hypothetical protein
MAQGLAWLRLDAGSAGFRSFTGTGPEYGGELSDLKQSLDFPGLALAGPSGWAAWTCCGEARVSPPDTETGRALVFSPQAGLGAYCELDLYTRSRPVRAALSFGPPGGKPDFAALSDIPFSPAPACPKVRGDSVVLASGLLKAGIAVREDGVSLLGIDLGDFSLSEDRPVLPLAKMLVQELSTGVLREVSAEKGWATVRVTRRETSVLVYLDGHSGVTDLGFYIEARAVKPNRIEWETRVINNNPGWTVLWASYPGVNFRGGDPALIIPADSGRKITMPYKRCYSWSAPYASYSSSMPLFGLYDESKKTDNGLYVCVHDGTGARKEQFVKFSRDCGYIENLYAAENRGKGANSFALRGRLVQEIFSGDWYDIAMIYRDFVHTRADWLPLHGREDTPRWMRDVPMYLRDSLEDVNPDDFMTKSKEPKASTGRWYKEAVKVADELGVPIGYHVYSWHWNPFDNDYPNYFPAKEEFPVGIEELHKHNVYVMPYINGRIWDTHDRRNEDYRFTKEALPYTSKCDGEHPDIETYVAREIDGNLVKLAVMCPSTWLWRKEVAGITGRLLKEYNVDAVYVDQIAAAAITFCADPSHNHTPGNGSWWREAYRLLNTRLRAEAPEGKGYTTECNAEIYADQTDGFLTWTWVTSDLVPIFPAIYGGYVAMLGRNADGHTGINENEDQLYYRYHIGQAVLFGQQFGWVSANLVNDPVKLSFVKSSALLRYKYREYFNAGDMLRPPALKNGGKSLVTFTAMNRSGMFDGETVQAAAWKRRRDGSVLIMAVNMSDEETEADFSVPWDEYGVKQGDFKTEEAAGLSLYGSGIRGLLKPGQWAVFSS